MSALLKELTHNLSSPTILPYNDEATRQTIDEIKVLFDKFIRIKNELAKVDDISLKALAYILNVQIKRQKRVILAYHMDRLMKLIRKMADSNDFSQSSLGNLSNSETKLYHIHADNLVKYKASLGPQINLFGPIIPPKDFFIQVRVEQDCGVIQTEHGKISLNRGTLHYLKRSDVEHLIIKGHLTHIM